MTKLWIVEGAMEPLEAEGGVELPAENLPSRTVNQVVKAETTRAKVSPEFDGAVKALMCREFDQAVQQQLEALTRRAFLKDKQAEMMAEDQAGNPSPD